MKKTILILMALAASLSALAQTQSQPIQGPIRTVYVIGNCTVDIVRDQRNFLEFSPGPDTATSRVQLQQLTLNDQTIATTQQVLQHGDMLSINDSQRGRFTLHLAADTLENLYATTFLGCTANARGIAVKNNQSFVGMFLQMMDADSTKRTVTIGKQEK